MNTNLKIAERVDVMPLVLQLQMNPQLWSQNKARLRPGSAHYQTDDIWLRYKDQAENIASGDYGNFTAQHFPIWYPAWHALIAARPLVFNLMARVEGEMLGGVLIRLLHRWRRVSRRGQWVVLYRTHSWR